MSSNRKLGGAAVVGVLALVGMTACSQGDGGGGGTEGEQSYTIGLVAPLAGPLSDAGVRAQNTMDVCVDLMNEGEAITRDDGVVVKLDMVAEDDKATPEGQIAAIRKLNGDSDALIGGLLSSPALAGMDVAESLGIPYLITGATTDKIEESIRDNAMTFPFHVAPNVSTRVADDLAASNELLGLDSADVFVVAQDTDYGRDVVATVDAFAAETGGSVVSQFVPVSTTEFSTVLLQLRNLTPAPDFVYVALVGAELFSFTQQLRDSGDPTFMVGGTNTSSSSNFVDELPVEVTEGVLTNLIWVPGAGNDEYGFAEAYESRFDRTPTDVESQTFDACLLLAEALRTSSSLDRADVAAALLDVEIDGLRGPQSFDAETHGHGPLTAVFAQVQAGEFVPVLPEAVAQGEFRR